MPGWLRKGKGGGDGTFPTKENACVCEFMSVSIMMLLGLAVYGSGVFLHSLNHALIYECAGHQWHGYKRELVWIHTCHSRIRPTMV